MPLTLLSSPRAPLSGRAAASDGRRRAWWIGGSVALHVLAVAALLAVRRAEPDLPMAPSYELLFDNGGASTPPTSEQAALDSTPASQPADASPALDAQAAPTPTEPQQLATALQVPAPDAAPLPAPPDPLPDPTPPAPQATAAPAEAPEPPPLAPNPSPPVQMAMAPPTEPAPPDPAPQPTEPVPSQPEAALPVPAPPPPAVRLAQPEPLPLPPTPQDLAPNLSPPALPPLPLPAVPALPRPRPAPSVPRQALGTLGAPMDLNFGQASSRAPAPRGSAGSRAIDFSLGTPKAGPNRSEAFFDARAANVGADWAQGLAEYWRRHRYYPRQAAENGEDGTVQVVLVVNRLGRVQSVEVKTRSGSPWLDMAALSVWRNAQLAPLPAENPNPTVTIPLTINYILLR